MELALVAEHPCRVDHLMIGDQHIDGCLVTGIQIVAEGGVEVAWDGDWHGPYPYTHEVSLRRPRHAPVRYVDPVRGIRAAAAVDPDLNQALRSALSEEPAGGESQPTGSPGPGVPPGGTHREAAGGGQGGGGPGAEGQHAEPPEAVGEGRPRDSRGRFLPATYTEHAGASAGRGPTHVEPGEPVDAEIIEEGTDSAE